MLHLGKHLALPTNIRLGCKGLQETKTLAYSENSLFPDVKSFITLGPGRQQLRSLDKLVLPSSSNMIYYGSNVLAYLDSTH